MKTQVVMDITGRQQYAGAEPEVIQLTTEGTMEFRDGGWVVSYQESELTGMEGVTTIFRVEPGKVTLTRKGALNSHMVFQEGIVHDSLYQMPFGALMLSVNAKQVYFNLGPEGGMIDLVYDISIENTEAGVIDYHLDIRAKQ